jgi:hypothetical protein
VFVLIFLARSNLEISQKSQPISIQNQVFFRSSNDARTYVLRISNDYFRFSFYQKKNNQTGFFLNRNRSNRPILVILEQKPFQTDWFRFDSVFSGLVWFFCGLARFFRFDSIFSGLARFFSSFFQFGSFSFRLIKPKPNQTG